MNIDPEYKVYKPERMEKWIFRKAVEDSMPYEVCWRPKEAFSDSVSGKTTLRGFLQEKISEITVNEEFDNYLHLSKIDNYFLLSEVRKNPPKTREECYYRNIFYEFYPKFTNHLSHYWMPPSRWFKEKLDDPSATILKV
jgi:asparagine synthase (glutamine-hydrolysing)